MKPSPRLVAKIGAVAAAAAFVIVPAFEGTVLKTYRDPVGILTSCTGHTGPELKPGQVWTQDQCAEQLSSDLVKHADDMACITSPMTPGQRVAVLSFTFNVGGQAMCRSTFARLANEGNWPAACAQLSRWTYAKGQELPGLVNRRAVERSYCEGKTL